MNFKSLILFCLAYFSIAYSFAQTEEIVKLPIPNGELEGTLLIPKSNNQKVPVVLIIAGSGPTDRNGNNSIMENNSLKMLAEGLLEYEIANLRYDKRGVGASQNIAINEIDLRFEDFIEDAKLWVDFLEKDERFNQVIVAGHSEGALIGKVVAQKENVAKFISLAGVGETADKILRRQLQEQPAIVWEASEAILDSLTQGILVEEVPTMLLSLFCPSVQPYLISWFQYNPQEEIAKLDKPVLIVQGSTDLQVGFQDAEMLSKSNPNAELFIIEGMNHIFKKAPLDRTENFKTYYEAELPLIVGFIEILIDFILED